VCAAAAGGDVIESNVLQAYIGRYIGRYTDLLSADMGGAYYT